MRLASSFVGLALALCARSTPLSFVKREAIPDYVLTYAPFSYIYSGEEWFLSDIATHMEHVTPEVDFVSVGSTATLETLSTVSSSAYLTSDDDVEDNPAWLLSAENTPDSAGYSAAPGTIICIEKDGGIVDAFYFAFYSYNHGLTVLGTTFGNHVGDWEHVMIRFVDSTPTYIYLSAHSGGSAYEFSALDTSGVRPLTYIATGSHANYATSGSHAYTLPFGILADTTDAGYLWDIAQNYRGFWYDGSTFTSAGGADIGGSEQTTEGVDWLTWTGNWGDEQYPDSDSRQDSVFGEYHYVDGPTGPINKNLVRTTACEDDDDCTIETSI